MQAVLPVMVARAKRLVLDADALNAVAVQPSVALGLSTRADQGRGTVLTPHPLEAARLLQSTVGAVQAARLETARRLAEQYGATVVLKGSGTVVATSGQLPQVNVTGNGALATGGTGDVLAGWLGGRWAGVQAAAEPPEGQRAQDVQEAREPLQAHRTACSAVFIHGRAADRLGSMNAVRALDLVENMRSELVHP